MFGAANASCVMDYKYTDNKISGMKYCDILSDQECVGVQSTNYVYILDEGMWVWLQLCELTRERENSLKLWKNSLHTAFLVLPNFHS